jgi:hypothetical protein
MTSFSALVDAPIAAACNLRGVETVIDIAGGNGSLLAALLRRHPGVRGALFDIPEVIERARVPGRPLTAEGIAPRVGFSAGNMFEAVPEGHDAYVLKWILHDWPDQDCIRVLERIAAAARPGARLLVAEMLLAPGRTANPARQLDLAMLLLTGGRERTASELQELAAGTGFTPLAVTRTASPMSIVSFVRA